MALEIKIIEILTYINDEVRNQNKIEEFNIFLQNSKKLINDLNKHVESDSNTYYSELPNALTVASQMIA